MKRFGRQLLPALLASLAIGIALWGALAIWFTVPLAESGRLALALAFAGLGLVAATVAFMPRRRAWPFLPLALASLTLGAWWWTITPSNDRNWQADVARLPAAEIQGDRVTLRNVRDFTYHGATDYTERWHDRTVDLGRLDRLDLFAVHWMGDDIAHTMVSFGFTDADPVVISIETRKEVGEEYSTLAGFFRRYELYFVVGEERDLVALRTTHREPPEDVYLFNIDIPKPTIRQLFETYLAEINALNDQPKFYNTATTNCTTGIVTLTRALAPDLPFSWKMLLSGHFASLAYDHGLLDQTTPFLELRAQSLINEKARAAEGTPDFSHRIRDGLPGTGV